VAGYRVSEQILGVPQSLTQNLYRRWAILKVTNGLRHIRGIAPDVPADRTDSKEYSGVLVFMFAHRHPSAKASSALGRGRGPRSERHRRHEAERRVRGLF
jgi:hypothetical protein